jgi:hypothetical protein
MTAPKPPCPCGDSYCDDTFGQATKGQDRSDCCMYCGFFDCDVCGWTATPALPSPARPVVTGWRPGDPAPF